MNGATVTVAGNKAQDKAWGTATNNDGNIDDDGFVQFAEQYFDKLTLRSVVDSFGRPSNRWANKGVEIGTYPKTAGASYTENVTLGTIYADLGMTDKDEKAEVYVDGVAVGGMKTNLSGKLVFSVELSEGQESGIRIVKR